MGQRGLGGPVYPSNSLSNPTGLPDISEALFAALGQWALCSNPHPWSTDATQQLSPPSGVREREAVASCTASTSFPPPPSLWGRSCSGVRDWTLRVLHAPPGVKEKSHCQTSVSTRGGGRGRELCKATLDAFPGSAHPDSTGSR